MSEPQTSWLCPACGRHVPRHVETCRCGVVRSLALPGVELGAPSHTAVVPGPRWARVLIGYKAGAGLTGGLRMIAAGVFVAKLGLTFATALAAFSAEPAGFGEEVQILARLDEFTRAQQGPVTNAIPPFLLLPGRLGVLPGGSAPNLLAPTLLQDDAAPGNDALVWAPLADIRPLSEGELRKGFCAPTLVSYVRQRFPGVYDAMQDAELEKRVLEKYPDYKERRCELPAWIGAEPHEIVKYAQPEQAGATIRLPPAAWAALATTLIALLGLNVYYRMLVPVLAQRAIRV